MAKIYIITSGSHFSNLLTNVLNENNFSVWSVSGLNEIQESKDIIIIFDCFARPIDQILEVYNEKKSKIQNVPFLFFKLHSMLRNQIEKDLLPLDVILDFEENFESIVQRINSIIKKIDIYTKFVGDNKALSEPVEYYEKYKIMLLDDDPYILKLLGHNLTNAGYDCITFNNGKEALESLKINIPDLILSDVMMPEMDGFQFRKILLENDKYKDIPFVFLTSKSDEDDMLSAYDLSITDYIVKTSGPKIVTAKVSSILKSLGKERQKVVKELNKALNNFQLKVVPDIIPQINKFEVKHWHLPYKGIPGGDFIDYYQIDNDRMIVVLGDVMGKKWNAWYFAVAYAGYVRSSIRFTIQNTDDFLPSTIIQKVNKTVYNDAKIAEVFATLSVLLLDAQNNTIKYSGAGDLPLQFVTKDGISQIHSNGLLLGFSEDGSYDDITIEFSPGDVLLLSTDGILDSRDHQGVPFGEKRFEQVLQLLYNNSNAIELFKEQFTNYVNNNFEDDISVITIRYS